MNNDTGDRERRGPAVDWHTARQRAAHSAHALASVSVTLADAVGRITATEVRSLIDVLHYPSAAMDGWAVRGPGPWVVVGETTTPPSAQQVVTQTLIAQNTAVDELAEGCAVAVVTGGTIPHGTEAVLRSESGRITRVGDETRLSAASTTGEPWPGQHIRRQGDEAHKGGQVIEAGVTLNPAHIAVAAVCGHDTLTVVAVPQVAVLLTGDEVISAGIPEAGQVRDSFGPQLPTLIGMLGAHVTAQHRVADTLAATVTALQSATGQVIVTTGGTGFSPADHLRAALNQLGATFVIDRVAMRPGGPTFVATLPGGATVIGLPGNPLAAMMGVFTVLEPLLAALGGRLPQATTRLRVAGAIAGRPGTSILLPYRLVDGSAVAGQFIGSGMMRGLAEAHGVMIVPGEGAEVDDELESIVLPWRLS